MTTIQGIVKSGVLRRHIRVSMKRPIVGGGYEPIWFDVSPYLVSISEISRSYTDPVLLNLHSTEYCQITLLNSERKFNPESEYGSFFYTYLTRYRTRFKIELIYPDSNDLEISLFTWYGVSYGSPITSDAGVITFDVSSPLKSFENYTAYGISTASGTTSQLIDRLVKLTAGGNRVFDQFLEGGNDSVRYKINQDNDTVTTISSPNIDQNDTILKKILDYSVIDNFYAAIDSTGNFVWKSKSNTGAVAWVFNGIGAMDNDYGVNIISIDEESLGINNTWTRVVIEYQDQTYVTSSSAWSPGDGSFQDIYGERMFSAKFTDLSLSEATTVADSLRDAYQRPRREWLISTVLIPHLNLNDLVEINYVGEVGTQNPFIVGSSQLNGSDVLAMRLGSINLVGVQAKIVSMTINLMESRCTFRLREP